jgi:hypothetical protein
LVDANVSAILGNPTPAPNPLTIMSGWQSYANQVAQNQAIQAGIANTQQNTTNAALLNQTNTQALQTTRSNRAAQVAFGLSNDPDLNRAKVITALDGELANGTIDQQTHDLYVNNLPADSAGGAALRSSVNSHLIGMLAGPQAIEAVTGTPITVDNGQTTQGGVRAGPLSPTPGALQMNGAAVPVGLLSGSSGAQRVPGPPNPDGSQTTVPLSSVTPTAQGGTAGAPNPTPQANPRLNPPSASPGTPAPGLPGQVTTTLPAESQATLATSAKLLADDDSKSTTFATDKIPYEQALQAYRSGVTTGPGTAWFNNVRQFIRAQLPAGVTADMVDKGDYDSLNKWQTQIALNRAGATSSVPMLETALTGNANTHINENAGEDVTKIGLAALRMGQAANQQFHADQTAGKATGSYLAYKQNFANTVDPRAFAYDLMNPEQKKSMQALVGKMTPAQLQKWNSSYALAKSTDQLSTTAMPQ